MGKKQSKDFVKSFIICKFASDKKELTKSRSSLQTNLIYEQNRRRENYRASKVSGCTWKPLFYRAVESYSF